MMRGILLQKDITIINVNFQSTWNTFPKAKRSSRQIQNIVDFIMEVISFYFL